MDYSNYPPYMQFDGTMENEMYKDPVFNPVSQYEQGYIYYKYLCIQMDYKIKCKEYEKLCENSSKNFENSRKTPTS